jgi:hypothetical protein
MVVPTHAILAEVYIQYTQHRHLYPIFFKHQTIRYLKYVNDILIT